MQRYIVPQESGIINLIAYGNIIIKNMRSSYDLPVTKNLKGAVNLSCDDIGHGITVFFKLMEIIIREAFFIPKRLCQYLEQI